MQFITHAAAEFFAANATEFFVGFMVAFVTTLLVLR